MPRQKLGMEMPHIAKTLAAQSHLVPRVTAETMLAGMPISSAMPKASSASSSVTGSF